MDVNLGVQQDEFYYFLNENLNPSIILFFLCIAKFHFNLQKEFDILILTNIINQNKKTFF
jgi:hypothetical protein